MGKTKRAQWWLEGGNGDRADSTKDRIDGKMVVTLTFEEYNKWKLLLWKSNEWEIINNNWNIQMSYT